MTDQIAASQHFTLADFHELGRRYGFHYRLPECRGRAAEQGDLRLVEGQIDEHQVRPGLSLVSSDVLPHHPYESTSLMTPRFSAIVVLQGRVGLQLAGERVQLASVGGVAVGYGDVLPMTGFHTAGQRLRSVNVSLCAPADVGDDTLSERIERAMRAPDRHLREWRVPGHLAAAVENLFDSAWTGPLRALLREGICLQLLAHALADPVARPPARHPVSARDRRMLARVIDCLQAAPGDEHRLVDLARLACMSTSSLRAKFLAVYGTSVFDWLRQRRLEVAAEHLRQGWSVQRVAEHVGYRHASNFATAFRDRYGVAPSDWA